jgi:hypothetical protein
MERRDMKRPLMIAHTHIHHTRIKLFFLSTDIAFCCCCCFSCLNGRWILWMISIPLLINSMKLVSHFTLFASILLVHQILEKAEWFLDVEEGHREKAFL